MQFRILLWKLKILIMKFRTYLLYIYMVLNVVFIPRSIVKAVQDDISSKTIRLLLRNAVQRYNRIGRWTTEFWRHRLTFNGAPRLGNGIMRHIMSKSMTDGFYDCLLLFFVFISYLCVADILFDSLKQFMCELPILLIVIRWKCNFCDILKAKYVIL